MNPARLWTKFIITISALLMVTSVQAEKCPIENPNIESGVLKVRAVEGANRDSRNYIQWKVTELALEKSGVPYDFDVSSHTRASVNEWRQLRSLGIEGNLVWGTVGSRNETLLLPVQVPLHLGLGSYWNIWVREDDERFANVHTLADLQEFTVLQGENWPTVPVLEAEGLEVRTGTILNLPKMLSRGRADMFFYSASDSQKIIDLGAKELGIVPLPHVMVRYPLDLYSYVDKCSTDIRDALLTGMEAAIADGSYEELLRQHAAPMGAYDKIKGGDYSLIEFDHPDLTEKTLSAMEKYNIEINSD